MSRTPTILAICVILTACGRGEKRSPSPWAERALVEGHGAAGGIGFELQIPSGWVPGPSEEWAFSFVPAREERDAPEIDIYKEAKPPATLEEAVAKAAGPDEIVVKQEATPDGFVVIRHGKNGKTATARVFRKKGDQALSCRIALASPTPLSNLAEVSVWLEKVCGSLEIGGEGED